VIVLYCSSRTPISWAIRAFTWSNFSHVGVLETNGKWVNEARYPRCRRVRLKTFLKDNGVVQPKSENCPRPDLAEAWMRKQTGYDPAHPDRESEGLPYDLPAIFGFMFHRDWTEEYSWFCSEFKTMAFIKGHSAPFMADALNRITPFESWILAGQILPKLKG